MNYDNIANAAAEGDDLTQANAGGFQRELPREGPALLRLRDYIELGFFKPKNPKHKNSLRCMLTFELLHPDHMVEINGDKVPGIFTINVNYAGTATSRYRKLFAKMNYTGKKHHFAQMLSDPFLGNLTHKKDGDKTYVNLDLNGEWNIGAPRVVDPLTNEVKEIPVPEMHGESKLFLWENAGLSEADIKECWDSLYIEGERDDGKTKNWIQETIRSNVNWQGSTTESVVDHADVTVDAIANAATAEAAPAAEQEAPVETPAAAQADPVDPLAALGL